MNVFELVAKLSLNSDEFKKGMEDSETKAEGFGSKLKSVIGTGAKLAFGSLVTAGAAAGTAVAAIGKSALESYSNYEQLTGGIKKLYGDATEDMMRFANQAYLTSGKSANDYMQTATSFSASLIKSLNGDTKKAAEITDVAMRAISDNVNTFGSDAAAVENAFMGISRQNYTMLDNLKLGYAGSAQGMLELINDSGVLGKTLKNTSDLANVGFDQMVLAIQKVQENQGIAGATAKEAMSTIEGSAVATRAAWENVVTAIGSGEGISEAISGLIKSLFGEGDGGGLINQIIPRVETIMTGISKFVIESAPMLLSALENVVGAIVTTIPKTVVQIIPAVYQAASSIVSTLFNYLMSNLPTLMSAGISLLNSVADGISSNMPKMLSTGVQMLSKFLATIMKYLPDLIVVGGKLVVSIASGLLKSVPSLLSGIKTIISSAVKAFGSYDWASLGRNIINGVVAGLKNAGGAIKDMLTSLAKSAFNAVKKFFGISSPSKLMRDQIGKFIPEGVAVGIEANADSVYKAMDDLSNMTVDAYDPDLTAVAPATGTTDGRGSGAITINVYPSEGMDEKRLAERIEEIISDMQMRRRAVYA